MLCPCPRCARHVRVPRSSPATSCPFCGFAGAWPAAPPLAGRLARLGSRAALVFGALEVGALGCSPPEVPALPPPPPAPSAEPTPSAQPAPSAEPAPAPPVAAPDAGRAADEPDASFPRATVAIYGAPPPPPRPPRPKK